MIYHHVVQVELGCGCLIEQRNELPDGLEPEGATALASMLDMLTDPRMIALIVCDDHVQKGNEVLTVTVRTRVGPVPDPEGETL